VSIRQQRPLRAATGSDDSSIVFFHGTPFKFETKIAGLHKGYVYGVAFSPDGSHLVSVGADKRIQLYDGKTGEVKGQIGEGEHKGSIFGISWAKDSKKFVTASADQTVKLWDVEAGKAAQTWTFGEEGNVSVSDHQVGVTWPIGRSDGMVISLNLNGDLNYLSEGSQRPTRIVQGHNHSITAIGLTHGQEQTLWTGSFEGRVCNWDILSGVGSVVEGQTHTNRVSGFSSTPNRVYSVGWDDTLRIVDEPVKTFVGDSLKLGAQPSGTASANDRVFVATTLGIEIFSKDELVGSLVTSDYIPNSIAASGNLLAIGDEASAVHIYAVDSDHRLSSIKTLKKSTAPITSLAFSPSGSLLAVGNSTGKIVVYDTKSWEVVTDRWSAHTARVTSIAWNDDSTHAVSGGLDTNVHVWSLKSPGKRVKAPNAHKDGVNGVCWVEGSAKVASVGGDAVVKIWRVQNLP
jgi:WD repeat-containing protein 1 (actin-interacting protein 1)